MRKRDAPLPNFKKGSLTSGTRFLIVFTKLFARRPLILSYDNIVYSVRWNLSARKRVSEKSR